MKITLRENLIFGKNSGAKNTRSTVIYIFAIEGIFTVVKKMIDENILHAFVAAGSAIILQCN